MADQPRDQVTGQFTKSSEPAEISATPAPAKNPYDLGDTSLHPEEFLSTTDAPKPPEPEKPPEPPAAPAAQATPKHDPRTLFLAQDVGLTEAQASAMSPQDLVDEIRVRVRSARVESPKSPPAPAAPPDSDPVVDLGEFEKKLDPEFAKELKAALGKVLGGPAKEVAALKAKLAEREQRETQDTQERWYQRCDEQFDKYPELFGANRAAAQADPDLMEARLAVLGAAVHAPAAERDGRFSKVLGALTRKLRPAAPATPAITPEGQSRPTLDDYQHGAVAQPTARTRIDKPGDEKALKTVQNWLVANGYVGGNPEAELTRFLPGVA